ncbi:MAG: prolyl aminopeptidase [Pseudomonadota bacterium]
MIEASHGHQLYVELSGNREGIPVIFLHGGPGAGISQNYLVPFDQKKWFIIAFDQRGCGQSTPLNDLAHNNSQLCVKDIETIRTHLNIEKWVVYGGSWGATLGLLYAIEHPLHVMNLVLRGAFLGRQEDVDFFITSSGAASNLFPQEFSKFCTLVNEKDDAQTICSRYFELLTCDDENIRVQSANQWFEWELGISRLTKENHHVSMIASPQQIRTLALFECYYLLHKCFIPENYILDNLSRISHIPMYLIHGRYDMICKVDASFELQKNHDNAYFYLIEKAGHSAQEQGIRNQLRHVMQTISKRSVM